MNKMKSITSNVIILVLLNKGGIVYRFATGYGVPSDMATYIKEETSKPSITHVNTGTGNLRGLRFHYWLKSYGLTSWCITSKIHPKTFGFKNVL